MATALWLMLGVLAGLITVILAAPFVLRLMDYWFDRFGNGRF